MEPHTLMTVCLVLLFAVISQIEGCIGDRVHDLINDESMCMSRSECFQRNFLIYTDVCVPNCPDKSKFLEVSTGTCFHECPINSVQNGTYCFSSTLCTVMNQKVYNRSCVDHCPNEFRFELAGVCYESCPVNTTVNGSLCIPDGDLIPTSNECPDEARFIIKESKTCVSACPDKMAALNQSCISDHECIRVHGFVVHDSSCIENCPSQTYLHDGFCKTKCPPSTYIDGAVCEAGSKCIDKGNYVYKLSCTESCPQEASVRESGYCVPAVCSDGYVLEDGECILGFTCSRLNKFIHNGTCVNSCPDTHPFIRHFICHSQCPSNTLPYLNVCIIEDKCWRMNNVVHKGHCLDSCPDTAPIPKGFGCVSVCPDNYVLYNNRCIAELECTVAMQYLNVQGHCIKKCSTDAPFLKTSTRECFPRCPKDTVVNGTTCEDKTTCTSNNKLIHNNTCVDSCPEEYRYNASWLCSQQCPPNTFPEDEICRSKSVCVNSGRYMHEGKCISRCPYPEEFVYDGDCDAKCPNGTKRLGVFCRVKACNESSRPLFDGKECISEFSCGKIQFEGGCIDYCPHEYFRYQDGCRELPDILHPVSVVLALVMMCIGTLVLVLYESEVS